MSSPGPWRPNADFIICLHASSPSVRHLDHDCATNTKETGCCKMWLLDVPHMVSFRTQEMSPSKDAQLRRDSATNSSTCRICAMESLRIICSTQYAAYHQHPILVLLVYPYHGPEPMPPPASHSLHNDSSGNSVLPCVVVGCNLDCKSERVARPPGCSGPPAGIRVWNATCNPQGSIVVPSGRKPGDGFAAWPRRTVRSSNDSTLGAHLHGNL